MNSKFNAYTNRNSKYVRWFRRNRVFTLIYAISVFPIYILSKLVPKGEFEIYGSYNGMAIGDNSWAAFQKSDTRSFFITRSRAEIVSKSQPGIVYCYSPKGLLLQLRAKKAYFCHTVDDFFAPTVMGATVVALSHGVPIKKMASTDKKLEWINIPIFKFVLLHFFPYLYYAYCNEVYSPNEFFDDSKRQIYAFTNPKLIRMPMPRISVKPLSKNRNGKVLLAPTFRRHQSLLETLVNARLFDPALTRFLENKNIEIWVKRHYIDAERGVQIDFPNRVFELDTQNINSEFQFFDALITDYSSIFYDASESGLAIRFLTHDLEHFNQADIELFDWFVSLALRHGSNSILEALQHIFSDEQDNLHPLWDIKE